MRCDNPCRTEIDCSLLCRGGGMGLHAREKRRGEAAPAQRPPTAGRRSLGRGGVGRHAVGEPRTGRRGRHTSRHDPWGCGAGRGSTSRALQVEAAVGVVPDAARRALPPERHRWSLQLRHRSSILGPFLSLSLSLCILSLSKMEE